MTDGRPAPGDRVPRVLERAPGDRYAQRTRPPGKAETRASDHPVARAFAFGLVAAAAVGALIGFLVAILDFGVGLIGLAAIGGWAIGAAARAGAGGETTGASIRAAAIAGALGAWVAGYFGAYVLSLLLRPASSLTFGERLAQSPFLDWLSPQFSLLQVVELVLIVGFAWFASRPRAEAGGDAARP